MLMNRPRLFEAMKRDGLDAVVATAPENVTYTSGFWFMSQWIRRGPQAYVLTPGEGRPSSTGWSVPRSSRPISFNGGKTCAGN